MSVTVNTIGSWILAKKGRYICACDVHSIVRAQDDQGHMAALRTADLVIPDGMPLVWVGKLKGHKHMRRICGPDLLKTVCARSVAEGWRHYFYGGEPEVVAQLAQKLAERYPGLIIAGSESPPYRPLTADEHTQMVRRIHATGPDIIWIGLGCPKQERWMLHSRDLFYRQILIGIGAAFDFEPVE